MAVLVKHHLIKKNKIQFLVDVMFNQAKSDAISNQVNEYFGKRSYDSGFFL